MITKEKAKAAGASLRKIVNCMPRHVQENPKVVHGIFRAALDELRNTGNFLTREQSDSTMTALLRQKAL